jgi:hypothetical protein
MDASLANCIASTAHERNPMKVPRLRSALLSLSLVLLVSGCKKTAPATDDATLVGKVASTLAADQNLNGQSIQSSVSNGVVTLSGSVSADTVRTIATGDVAQIPGVKTVVDNLVVQAPPTTAAAAPTPTPAPAPAPAPAAKQQKPSAAVALPPPPPPPPAPQSAPVVRNLPEPLPPAPVAKTPPPPPAPVVHNVTIPTGTAIPVRITQTLDSATAIQGDKFTGIVASDIIVDGMVAIAQGTPVTGHVDAVQDAAHFKGSSLLTISLSAIDRKGTHIELSTESYSKQGAGRGKNTAAKVGGGAAVGAILGGILGGGKGAAIGAAAGGGIGAGANSVTRGQQVQIPSESEIHFRLLDPIVVRVVGNGAPENSSSSLGTRNY